MYCSVGQGRYLGFDLTGGKISDYSGAEVRIRIADRPPQRIGTMGAQHMPGEEAWLVGERCSIGERKYYLSKLPADTPLKDFAWAIKAR